MNFGGFYELYKARLKGILFEFFITFPSKSTSSIYKLNKNKDYKKFLYEQKKREKVMKAKASKVVVKEIRFGPQTDDHDYEFKRSTLKSF